MFGTSAYQLAGREVSIRCKRNLGAYGSPLKFVVPPLQATRELVKLLICSWTGYDSVEFAESIQHMKLLAYRKVSEV